MKNWRHAHFEAEAARTLLDRLLARHRGGSDSIGASLTDGRALHVRARNAVDLATLPHAASLCFRYLGLKDGELAALNEPFAGGVRLSDVTFVAAVSLGRGAGPDLLIMSRVRFAPRLALDEALDSEGVRIPPTPIGRFESPNEAILGAIAAHPLAPPEFYPRAMQTIRRLSELARTLKAAAAGPKPLLDPERFESYLEQAGAAFRERVAKLPLGRAVVAETLATGETIKLALDVREERVSFDFAGTDSSVSAQLTDRATFGACFSAACAVAQAPIEANAGAFACIEVRSVPGSMVNAKAPSGLGRGAVDLAAVVSELALRAFAQNRPTLKRASSSVGMSRWQIAFSDGKRHFDGAFGGVAGAASPEAPRGWSRGESPSSIESAERNAPVEILTRAGRTGSAGTGVDPGRDGQIASVRALAAGELTWSLACESGAAGGFAGGSSGAPCEAELIRSDGTREPLARSGRAAIQAGDAFEIRTAGGGGFGAPARPAGTESADA